MHQIRLFFQMSAYGHLVSTWMYAYESRHGRRIMFSFSFKYVCFRPISKCMDVLR